MKKIIRLTEGDLHRIIKESVKRIIREGVDDDPEAARLKQAWRDAQASRDVNAMLAAKKAYMDYIGQNVNTVRIPQGVDPRTITDAENAKLGITPSSGARNAYWRVGGDIGRLKDADIATREADGPRINPEMGIDVSNAFNY